MQSVLQAEYERSAGQAPLIHIVDYDDVVLINSAQAEWFLILKDLPWERYRTHGANYYDALYEFNCSQAIGRQEGLEVQYAGEQESKEQARQRVLWDRATMRGEQGIESSIVYQRPEPSCESSHTDPQSIAPGVVPIRFGGRTPKCFFSMFKSFLGATLMGFPAEPESVHMLLTSNPSFVRVCGFTPVMIEDSYSPRHVPSLRKLQQFDQIMTGWGIWGQMKLEEVRSNLASGAIRKENELVGDTTHYYAYSSFETVTYLDEKGKERTKSQSRLTKSCRCEDWTNCRHPWQQRDEGAGTIVKSNKKMYWGHKASILGYPRQGVPLDAVAVCDAATFDGKTLYPHVVRVFEELPEIKDDVERVLYDSACDDEKLKAQFRDVAGNVNSPCLGSQGNRNSPLWMAVG